MYNENWPEHVPLHYPRIIWPHFLFIRRMSNCSCWWSPKCHELEWVQIWVDQSCLAEHAQSESQFWARLKWAQFWKWGGNRHIPSSVRAPVTPQSSDWWLEDLNWQDVFIVQPDWIVIRWSRDSQSLIWNRMIILFALINWTLLTEFSDSYVNGRVSIKWNTGRVTWRSLLCAHLSQFQCDRSSTYRRVSIWMNRSSDHISAFRKVGVDNKCQPFRDHQYMFMIVYALNF